jgi:hypothetical protein
LVGLSSVVLILRMAALHLRHRYGSSLGRRLPTAILVHVVHGLARVPYVSTPQRSVTAVMDLGASQVFAGTRAAKRRTRDHRQHVHRAAPGGLGVSGQRIERIAPGVDVEHSSTSRPER